MRDGASVTNRLWWLAPWGVYNPERGSGATGLTLDPLVGRARLSRNVSPSEASLDDVLARRITRAYPVMVTQCGMAMSAGLTHRGAVSHAQSWPDADR